MKTLKTQLSAVLAARKSLESPPEEIIHASQELERLSEVLRKHNDSLKDAVEAYEQARRNVVIRWAKQHKMGFCSRGKHLAPVTELEGLVTTGAYVTSGYYEHLRGFSDHGTVCRGCRHHLRGGPGRYSGEFSTHDTHELANPLESLQAIAKFSNYDLTQLAKKHDIELPPELCLKSNHSWDRTLVLGDQEI